MIAEGELSGDGVRVRAPVIGGDGEAGERGKRQTEIVDEERAHRRGRGKIGRVGDDFVAFGKTREQTHVARAQAIRCAQRQRGRFASGEGEFPDVIVGVIGGS